MAESNLLHRIAQKGSDKEAIAEKVISDPGLLPELFSGLSARKAGIKYGSEKVLRIISEKKPELLYSRMDVFIDLLDGENSILKWGSILVIANLASVDSKNRIEKIFKKYFAPIPGPVLITAANIIGNSYKIALAKPRLTEKIAREILKVERARYRTAECRNVAIGGAIDSLGRFFHQIKNREPVLEFVKKQVRNRRPSTRKKAEKFLKKHAAA